MFDVQALLARVDVAALVERDLGQPQRREGQWLKWRCPFHADRTPSLGVAGKRWKCFGCGRSGDALDWLQAREGLTFQEACRRLGALDLSHRPVPALWCSALPSVLPVEHWQQLASEAATWCQQTLWSDQGARARAWLNRRGLVDETLRTWRVGFNPRSREIGGLWLPRGIVIPGIIDGRAWYLKVRRASDQYKYTQVKGGQIALFGADTLVGREAAVITEGEFDAMLLHQEAGDLVGVATLGSAAARLPDRWVPYLLSVRWLLIAYDTDGAGRNGAAAWCAMAGRSSRLLPLAGKDITDYFLAGGDLRAWVRFALEVDR